jgi:hypothetical protein
MKRVAAGLPKYSPAEIEARRLANKARHKRNKEKLAVWLAAYKVEQGCADCGYSQHPAALDFDHLPGTEKKFDISQFRSHVSSLPALMREIEKCEVVCANCHRIRTSDRLLVVLSQ